MPSSRMPGAVLIIAVLLMTLVSSALGGGDSGRAILERSIAHYSALPAYAAQMEISIVPPAEFAAMGGEMPPSHYDALAARDGRVAFRPKGGMISDPFVQNDSQWFVEIEFLQSYIIKDAVPLAQLLDGEGDSGIPIPGCREFLALSSKSNQSGSFLAAETISRAGAEKVNGVSSHRLELSGGGFEGSVWVADDETPWVTRIRLSPPAPPSDEQNEMMMMQPGLDIAFSGWNAAPNLEDAFVIEINESFTRRDSMPGPEDFAEAAGPGPGTAPGGDQGLVGKSAPATTLPTLDGQEMTLGDLRGKVVELDFWATWCKPCLAALPGMIKTTSKLADRGAVFWTVNQREKTSAIRALLEKNGWSIRVALDLDGKASAAFGVRGIPHTVIIDRNGVVRHVHTGYMPGIETVIGKEIEALL